MLDLIVAKALQKQPAARYQSAAQLAADLRSCLGQLTGSQGALPAASEATPRLDAGAATEAQIDVRLEMTRSTHADETNTATLGPAVTDAGTYLPVSRKFESAAALRRLTELAAASGADGADAQERRGVLALLWRYPGRLFFALAVVAASAIAYYIAYYY